MPSKADTPIRFAKTKALMFGHPDAWHRLCGILAELVGDYLVAQIEAGVDAVQVFDSWVGALSAADYAEFALPHSRRIFEIVGDAGARPSTSAPARRRCWT